VVPTIAANRDLVTQWVKTASQVSKPKNGGRGANPSPKDIDDYGNDAAWRCQFSGCGLNLLHHKATGSTNKSSYFAHIVASSKDGPRGGDRSHELSADINNFILLCDDCHRLIDRRDPDRYTEAILLRMRAESLAEVRRLLDTLAYPAADIIVLMGCISTQAPHYIHSLAEPAMWLRKTRATPGHPRHYFANDWTLHSPHNKEYWSSFFRKAGSQLSEIRSVLAPANRADEQKRLAVFPLHGTSVLVLAGRIFGEAAAVDVHQYRRERPSTLPGGPWGYEEHDDTKSDFLLETLATNDSGQREGCLIVSLTFDVDFSRLPPQIWTERGFAMPSLRVKPEGSTGHDSIKHPADLDRVSKVLGQAIAKLQDEWRLERVHLIIGAPASVAFKIGQKLQARHQADFVCYESETGGKPNAAFLPTITIGGLAVTHAQDQSIQLSLSWNS
jgi:hypothetical protein